MRLLICIGCIGFSSMIFARDVGGLCMQGVEGTYSGKIGKNEARINLICVDKERLMASLYLDFKVPGVPNAIDTAVNLNRASVDGDQLILSNFETGNEERRTGSSKSLVNYIRVDLALIRE